MPAADLFEGFAERQAQLEERYAERYGEGVREHFRTARERTRDWTRGDYDDAGRRWERIDAQLLVLLRSGAPADDPRTRAVVAEHHRVIGAFWTPDLESYPGLGRSYVQDPAFRARYDAQDPGLAAYLCAAIAAYAGQHLA